MRILVDTGAAMNSGHLDYHLWVMSQYSEMVAEFLQCGKNTNCDVVQLLATLDLNLGQLPNNHGQMTAVIRYYTPYLVNNKDPLILSFALGNDMCLCSVLGLPTPLSMGVTIDLLLDTLSCSELNYNFQLIFDPPGKGLPDGVSLDTSTIFVPPGVRSNLSTHLQYTAMDGVRPTIYDSNPFDNIVVTDKCFEGNVSRTLSYSHSERLSCVNPLTTFDVIIGEGDLAVETRNNVLPRLRFYKLRSQFKLNNYYLLNT